MIDQFGTAALYLRRKLIFCPPQLARHIYKVEAGCVRAYVMHNGRRLITGFYFSGDYFGLEPRRRYCMCADMLTPGAIRAVSRQAIEAHADAAGVAAFMLEITNAELQRAHAHALLLRDPASQRVANFLLEIKARNRSREAELVMSRQDIADYLNLTIESVLRALTLLERRRKISFRSHRRVSLHFRKRLAA